jgi:hypothetical protein
MGTRKGSHLQKLFLNMQHGAVVTAPHLEGLGISRDLQNYYIQSKWLEPVGRGAYKIPASKLQWPGMLSSLQQQTKLEVHLGALSALHFHREATYIRMEGKRRLQLFTALKKKLPGWFLDYQGGFYIEHHKTSFLPEKLMVRSEEIDNWKIKVASNERAAMECLYLAPKFLHLVDCYRMMLVMAGLIPEYIMALLLNCKSVKVKRLFLYMGERARLPWFDELDHDKIDLGSGKRSFEKNGMYVAKYQIVVPKAFANTISI